MIPLLASFLLFANSVPDSTAVSSANASYDGNSLVLKGQVLLDHGLGTMKAEEAILDKQEVGKDFPFSFIRLRKDVLLTLSQTSSLSCETADLDFTTLKGHLTGKEKLRYTDSLKRKKGGKTVFSLTSKQADLDLSKQEKDSEKPHYEIASILAQDTVEVEYDQKYVLHADTALYRKLQNQISAYSQKEETLCQLTYDENSIEAKTMNLDLMRSEISMQAPRGTLHSLASHLSKAQTQFSSDTLFWNHLTSTLSLKGHVHLQDPSLGTVVADEEVKVIQTDREISSIKTQGKTTVNYLNTHKLTCFGTIDLNKTKLQGNLTSPLLNGSVPSDQQISYQEEEITIFADTGYMEYTIRDGQIEPIAMSLKGNVHLFSHDPSKPVSYGITDRITYSPTTRTFILSADPGKRVIFISDDDGTRISAQEVHITQDPETHKQTVKGIGNVHLALSSEEEALIQKIFNLSKIIP